MPAAAKSLVLAATSLLVAGAAYLVWTRGSAMLIDLSGGLVAFFCG